MKLNKRETQILTLISQGRAWKQIADDLKISKDTIRHHLEHIREKTETYNNAHSVAVALRNGLIQ